MSPSVHHLHIEPTALKALRDIPQTKRDAIVAAIDALAKDPRPQGHQKLTGYKNLYRVRVGDYRVVYAIVDRVLTVVVILIGQRGDIYEVVKRFMKNKGKEIEVAPKAADPKRR
ncbi:MAG: type II toxin-antitoxin system RelE/ParE family toxin [Planctomycetes bacterium]|nr:type II toxin-antitoxin system RelE/ParE family toxin [Planctomycetota bacterium]